MTLTFDYGCKYTSASTTGLSFAQSLRQINMNFCVAPVRGSLESLLMCLVFEANPHN